MKSKEILDKVEEWLRRDISSEDIPSAVRINSKVLLEYIHRLQKDWQEG